MEAIAILLIIALPVAWMLAYRQGYASGARSVQHQATYAQGYIDGVDETTRKRDMEQARTIDQWKRRGFDEGFDAGYAQATAELGHSDRYTVAHVPSRPNAA